jgi:putative ABC transport system permease protein
MAEVIPWGALLWCLVPIFTVVLIFKVWDQSTTDLLIASSRMVVQLLTVGYVLIFLFAKPSLLISVVIIFVMLLIASWIAVRPVKQHPKLWGAAVLALCCSVLIHLGLSVFLVIRLEPWYLPSVLIPLAGMYFANTMNSISLSVERFYAELSHNKDPVAARNSAFKAAMIPQLNGLLAVGVVALPGMMTGQILSGVSPLIAVRYQIMIMTMLLGCSGVGADIILQIIFSRQKNTTD